MNLMLSGLGRASWRFSLGAVFCCLSLFVGPIFAQSGTGVITGRVTNQATREPLWNASVAVRGTALSVATDRDGSFRITGVPSGSQTLVTSYSGLETSQTSVTVAADAEVNQDLALTADYYVLEKVVVKGIKEGQSLAIQQQKLAPNSKVVAAMDAYGNPSANPGELVQRLSEVTTEIVGSEVRSVFIRGMSPEFSVLQVDGQQVATSRGTGASREFQIEQMGTGNLQSIELIKAPRPQDDANSVAGFVNLVSKRAFDSPGRHATLTVGTMWRGRESDANPFQDKFDGHPDVLALSYSDTFSIGGDTNNLGILINASHRRSSTGQDEVGAGLTATGNGALYFPSANAAPITRVWGTGDFFYTAVAESLSGSVDYRLKNGSYLYVKTAYNTNNQDQRFYRWDISTTGAASSFTAATTSAQSEALPIAASQAQTWSALFEKRSVNYSVNPGASFKLMNNTANLDLSYFYSYADIIYPNYNTGRASTNAVAPGGLGWALDFRGDAYHPGFTQTAGPSVTDAASYTPNLNQHIHWWAPTENQNVKADFKKDFTWKVPVTVQAGAKYQINDQRQERDWENRSAWSGPTGMAAYTAARYRQAGGRYGPFPFLREPGLGGSADLLNSPFLTVSDSDAYTNVVNSIAADAEFEEKIAAAYVQANFRIGKLNVLTGLRFEKTENEGQGYTNNGDPALNYNSALTRDQNLANARAKFTRIKREGSYDYYFPGVHLSYNGPGDLIYRASFNRSITRPAILSTLPNATYNPAAATPTVTVGNPDLKPYLSDNYEISVEKYFEPIGKFTLNGFYKELDGYFTNFTSIIGTGPDNGFGGQFAGYTLSTPRNIGKATIKGISTDYSQQFTFLPGFLKDFGVFGNFTWLKADGQFTPNVTNTATFSTLPGLVPKSGNAGLSYVGHGFQLRLLANYRDKFVFSTPATNTANDTNINYRERRTIFDFKSLYRINERFDLFLDVYNLSDEPTSTQSVAGRQTYTLWQGTSYSAGVTARF